MGGVGGFGLGSVAWPDHLQAGRSSWHFKMVVIAVGLGVFAPRAEHALSGAGWQATGSESVAGAASSSARSGPGEGRRSWSSCFR